MHIKDECAVSSKYWNVWHISLYILAIGKNVIFFIPSVNQINHGICKKTILIGYTMEYVTRYVMEPFVSFCV